MSSCLGSYNCKIGHSLPSVHMVDIVLARPTPPSSIQPAPSTQPFSETWGFLEKFPAKDLKIIRKGVR